MSQDRTDLVPPKRYVAGGLRRTQFCRTIAQMDDESDAVFIKKNHLKKRE